MKFVEPKAYLIAQTSMNRQEVRRWLDDMGAAEAPIDVADVITDPEQIVGLAGKRCYKSYVPGLNPNVSKVRKEWGSYFNNILKSGHGSVLEHANYTFALENVSRVFTAEMNRHRAGVAISEQSLRYVRFEDIPFWIPNSIKPKTDSLYLASDDMALINEASVGSLEWKKAHTRNIIKQVLESTENAYKALVKIWDFDNMTDFHTKKVVTSMLRRIVPLGVATGAVYTLNGRAIRHVLTMRATPEAEEEICLVASQMAKIMIEQAPLLMQDFKQTPEGFWYPEYRKV